MHAAAYDKNKKLFATKKWFLFVCDRRASALKKGSLTEAIGLSGFAEWTLGSSNSYINCCFANYYACKTLLFNCPIKNIYQSHEFRILRKYYFFNNIFIY